jgi:hypothetical protein
MESMNNNPNYESPDTVAELTKNLEIIFDYIGNEVASSVVEGSPLDIMRAEFAIDNCEFATIPDGALPIVKICKWVNPNEDARWLYEISYSMQNEAHSRHALILKGENSVVEIGDRHASPDEVKMLVNDFRKFSQF